MIRGIGQQGGGLARAAIEAALASQEKAAQRVQGQVAETFQVTEAADRSGADPVGKLKESHFRQAADDYLSRIARYARVAETELKDGKPELIAERFERALSERSLVVALEVSGRSLSSEGLASYLDRSALDGSSTISFLIGGADGLPREVSARADLQLSLSAMTLPHRLARIVLLEQIYRAFTILRGEPYSH